eukprot:3842531-Pyramimonas_sp.AAC.1
MAPWELLAPWELPALWELAAPWQLAAPTTWPPLHLQAPRELLGASCLSAWPPVPWPFPALLRLRPP